MVEKEPNLSRFLKDVFSSGADEVHCNEAGDLMVQAANAQLKSEEVQVRYPALWRHFEACSDCAQEYDLLLELTRREMADQLEPSPHPPALPDSGDTAVWQRARDAITAIFPGFAPELATAVTRGQELLFAPVEVSLWDGRLSVEFDLAPHEADPHYRDLYITMSSEENALATLLDGLILWLQINDEGPASHKEILLEADAVFRRISPGTYSLRWWVENRECAVTNISLP